MHFAAQFVRGSWHNSKGLYNNTSTLRRSLPKRNRMTFASVSSGAASFLQSLNQYYYPSATATAKTLLLLLLLSWMFPRRFTFPQLRFQPTTPITLSSSSSWTGPFCSLLLSLVALPSGRQLYAMLLLFSYSSSAPHTVVH